MFDVALVTRALAGTGQDVTATIVDEVLRLSQGAEHQAAAARAEREIAAGATDVRLFVALLLAVFAEQGPAALPAIFDTVAATLGPRWEVVRPAARRDRAVDSALSLLFRSVKATLDFHERLRDATWRTWAERVGRDAVKATTEAAGRLQVAIESRIPAPKSLAELHGLRSRAELHLQRIPLAEAKPAPEPAATETRAVETRPADTRVAETRPADTRSSETRSPDTRGAAAKPAAEPPPPAAILDEPTPAEEVPPSAETGPGGDEEVASSAPAGVRWIEASPALEQFIRKLEAFDVLVQRGDLNKAAIVALDIRSTVEHFDPRVYLPRLLTPHFRLLSAHVAKIAPHWEASHAPSWEALTQLYQVDLDAFLET